MFEDRIIIVGAGIVGLACADFLAAESHNVCVIDPDHEGDKASYGNAAGIAVTECIPASSPGVFWKIPGWLLDPLGPLALRWSHAPALMPWFLRFSQVCRSEEMNRISAALADLNGRTYDDLLPMLERNGLSSELKRLGALTVYETDEAFKKDKWEWDLKRRHGIECQELSGPQARELEPALSKIVQRAVFTPQWSQVSEPRKLHNRMMKNLRDKGVQMLKGKAIAVQTQEASATVLLQGGGSVSGAMAVVAAGAWSKPLAASIGDRVLLESERGYNTTLPHPGIDVTREIIFAERKFVATPIDSGLRIGGAAEFGGLTSAPNMKRADAVLDLARAYLPGLVEEAGVQWSGHRPATPDSLPVIGHSPRSRRLIYAFGHGHLGLTQSATTGRLVADIIANRDTSIDLAPFSIQRF